MKEVKSPCKNICRYNDKMCTACYRTIDEIASWLEYSNEEKLKIIEAAKERKLKIAGDYYGNPF